MQKMAISYALVLATLGVASACDQTRETRMSTGGLEYVSTEAELIGDGLVKISAFVKNVESDDFDAVFTACVAAPYVLLRGFAFGREISGSISQIDDIRTATSIYIFNARLPAGVRKLDAEVVAVNCAKNGIPMV